MSAAERTFTEGGDMHCKIRTMDGEKWIKLDDLIAYFKTNAQAFKEIPDVYRVLHEITKAFIWTKNNQ